MPRDYLYDQGFSEECTRLGGIESLWDRGSPALIDARGITDGWSRLEVGAGGGSLVQSMAGWLVIVDSGSPGFHFSRVSFQRLRDAVVDAGLLSGEDADAAATRFTENRRIVTPLMMAGLGSR